MLRREGRHRAGARLFLFRGRARSALTLDANGDVVVILDNADPDDQHLAGRIVAVDDGMIPWLERREKKQTGKLRMTGATSYDGSFTLWLASLSLPLCRIGSCALLKCNASARTSNRRCAAVTTSPPSA